MVFFELKLSRTDVVKATSEAIVRQHVANGGCIDEFNKAMHDCNSHRVGVEECIKATAALRECFAGNPDMFKHQYLRRIDEGLDQGLKPSPDQEMKERLTEFRWWTGMRRC